MATVSELVDRLEALHRLRASGTARVTYDGKTVEYRSDGEIVAAIADIERQIAAASRQRVTCVRIVPSKGLV